MSYTTVNTIIDEICESFFERREHVEAIFLAMLSGSNVYLLGDPGTGKSALCRAVADRVTGGNYKELLLDRQLPMESLFGPIDIIDFRTSGKYHRSTDGYLPWAHFIFLDEVGKAGPAVLNPLLTLLNEGIYHNNSVPMDCNIRVAVGASNEELETELAAMWDRWLLRLIVNPIQEPGNFAKLLTSGLQTKASPTTIDLADIDQARKEVSVVTIPPGIADKVIELKVDLETAQIAPSDRRWVKAMNVVRAEAWRNGRDEADEDDLAPLRHVLWDVVEQIPRVEELVLKHSSEFAAQVIKFERELDEVEAHLTSLKGQSLATRSQYGAQAQVSLTGISSKVADLKEKAKRQGRNTTRLDSLNDRALNVRKRVFVECLDIPADRAVGL